MREAVRLALSSEWTLAAALEALGDDDLGAIIATYEASLAPLAEVERIAVDGEGQFGPGMTELRTWLKPIGMKIAPTMSKEQCGGWLTAVALALSDLPARIAAQAARAAIHIPINFLNEVDGEVRAEAIKIMDRHKTAMRRLISMREEIERARRSQAALPAPDPLERFSPDEIRKMSADVRRLGLSCGALTQEEIDAADRLDLDRAA